MIGMERAIVQGGQEWHLSDKMITAQRSEGNEHVSQISKGRGFRAEGPLSMEALKWMCTVCGKSKEARVDGQVAWVGTKEQEIKSEKAGPQGHGKD